METRLPPAGAPPEAFEAALAEIEEAIDRHEARLKDVGLAEDWMRLEAAIGLAVERDALLELRAVAPHDAAKIDAPIERCVGIVQMSPRSGYMAVGPTAKSLTMNQDDWLRVFGPHLVGIVLTWRFKSDAPDASPRVQSWTATVLMIEGVVSLLTAGHVIAEINKAYAEPEAEVLGCVLVDCFSADAPHQHAMPFPWVSAEKGTIVSDNMDVGVVFIPPSFVGLMVQNGIKAITEENWVHQHRVEFDAFLALGMPQHLTGETLTPDGGIHLNPNLVKLERLSPDDPELQTDFDGDPSRMFVGRLMDGGELADIKGMSGGPIFGLRAREGELAYWVVAIIRGFYDVRRIVTGSRLTDFGPAFARAARDAITRGDLDSEGE